MRLEKWRGSFSTYNRYYSFFALICISVLIYIIPLPCSPDFNADMVKWENFCDLNNNLLFEFCFIGVLYHLYIVNDEFLMLMQT